MLLHTMQMTCVSIAARPFMDLALLQDLKEIGFVISMLKDPQMYCGVFVHF